MKTTSNRLPGFRITTCPIHLVLIGLIAIIAGGCQDKKGDHAGHHHADGEMHEVELFDHAKGVRLPEEVRRTLGIETVEVTEKSVKPELSKQAQVYRPAQNGKPGTAVLWLSEAEAKDMQQGQFVKLQSTANGSAPIEGKITKLEHRSALGQVEALLEFPPAEKSIGMGAILTVTFPSERVHTAMAVPRASVIDGVEGPFVYTANGEHFVRTPVKLGITREDWMEVTDGLYAGDFVVSKAPDSLWLIELCARKGGSPCCEVPLKR